MDFQCCLDLHFTSACFFSVYSTLSKLAFNRQLCWYATFYLEVNFPVFPTDLFIFIELDYSSSSIFSRKVLRVAFTHWKLHLWNWSFHYWKNVRVAQQWGGLFNSNQFVCQGLMRLAIMAPEEFYLQTMNKGFSCWLTFSLNKGL